MLVHHTFVSGTQGKCLGCRSRTSSPARHVVITNCKKSKTCDVGVAISDMTFIPDFVKSVKWLKSLKYTYTHTQTAL
jgi:hypothetical protein